MYKDATSSASVAFVRHALHTGAAVKNTAQPHAGSTQVESALSRASQALEQRISGGVVIVPIETVGVGS